MRMNVKFISTAVVSAGVGATLAWAITADLAEKKARHMADDIVALRNELRTKNVRNLELRNALDDKTSEVEVLQAAIDQETGFTDENLEAEVQNSPGEISSENKTPEIEELHIERAPIHEDHSVRDTLLSQIREYVPSVEDERVVMEEQGGPVIAHTKYTPPYVISQPEYAHGDEGMHYAKITLKWYPNQQVLLDEEEEPISDVDRYCGWRSLSQFGGESGDPDIVYVRNRNSETDYEVEKQPDDAELPLHVRFGMPQMEFQSRRAAGKIRLPEDGLE